MCPPLFTVVFIPPAFFKHTQNDSVFQVIVPFALGDPCQTPAVGLLSKALPHVFQILGMAFSMTLFQHIHRTGKKYDA